MKTFNNNPKLKAELVQLLEHHQKMDNFIQGTWLFDEDVCGEFKGCFYGCTMQTETDALLKFSEKYHIDLWLVHLSEAIFENLTVEQSKTFPLDLMKALPVGVDINDMKSHWFKWLLKKQLKHCGDNVQCIDAINQCIELFSVPFLEIKKELANSVAESAWLVAESAESAANSAAESAWSAASAARSAEWADNYQEMATMLISKISNLSLQNKRELK